MTDDNPTRDLTINDLETAVYVAQLHVFAPTTVQLMHIAIWLENYLGESWTRIVSIISTTTVGLLLREAMWIFRQTQMHASVAFISEVDNHETDAESILTHINVAEFTYHFNSTFPQQDFLADALPTMCREASHAYNGAHKSVAAGMYASTLQKEATIYKQWEAFCTWLFIPSYLAVVKDPMPFLHIFLNGYYRSPCCRRTTQSKNKAWRNTSAPWGKYSWQWGPRTPESTLWEASTLDWYNSLRPM